MYFDGENELFIVVPRDENYCTALILAASKGHVKVMKLLMENLAEVNVSDKLKVSFFLSPVNMTMLILKPLILNKFIPPANKDC